MKKKKDVEIIDMSTLSLDSDSYVSNIMSNLQPTQDVVEDVEIIDDDKPQIPIAFTAVENSILIALAEGKTPKQVAFELGIPSSTINKFLARKEAAEHLQEMISARNLAIKSYLPKLLSDIIEAKVDRVTANPELTLADASKKDVLEIAKVLGDILKNDSGSVKEEATGFNLIYQQINNLSK